MRSCGSWGHANPVVCEAASLSDEDLGRETHVIVAAAQQAAAVTGRLCRLVEAGPVFVFLRSYRDHKSRAAACRVSGFCVETVRQWIVDGCGGRQPFASFLAALGRIDAARLVRETPAAVVNHVPEATASETTPAVATVSEDRAPLDVAAESTRAGSPTPTPEQLASWTQRAARLQAKVCAPGWRASVPSLYRKLQAEMAAYDLSLPELELVPADLSLEERHRLYLEWCTLNHTPLPTDLQLERDAALWYRRMRAREIAWL